MYVGVLPACVCAAHVWLGEGGQERELVQYFCILSLLLKMPGLGDDIAAPTEEEGRAEEADHSCSFKGFIWPRWREHLVNM